MAVYFSFSASHLPYLSLPFILFALYCIFLSMLSVLVSPTVDPSHLCVPSSCLLCCVASMPLSHSQSSPSIPSPGQSPTRSYSLTPPPTPNTLTTDQGSASGTMVAVSGRRHRHSISGQMSYFKMLGFGPMMAMGVGKKMAGTGGSTSSLFSTAVISGSSSAPNLRDMIPNSASVSGKQLQNIQNCEALILYSTTNIYQECQG